MQDTSCERNSKKSWPDARNNTIIITRLVMMIPCSHAESKLLVGSGGKGSVSAIDRAVFEAYGLSAARLLALEGLRVDGSSSRSGTLLHSTALQCLVAEGLARCPLFEQGCTEYIP